MERTAPPEKSKFAAADPALGYLYQILSGLLWSLQKARESLASAVSIETLDDVTFETAGGEVFELVQTKHHRKGLGALTDFSVDLWKSLRVWIESDVREIHPNAALHLVTSATATSNSAAAFLRATSDRDTGRARELLDTAATSSTSEENTKAYAAYLSLTLEDRSRLLDRVVVIDSAPIVADLAAGLHHELRWAAPGDHLDSFVSQMVGWWVDRVLRQMVDRALSPITFDELEAQVGQLREQFKTDNLPIDSGLLDLVLDADREAAYRGFVFVKQIELSRAGAVRITHAIRNYLRAVEQRSKWMREELVVDLELKRYERRLVEAWELTFAAMCDELGATATEERREAVGRAVLNWAEHAAIPIRPGVAAPFLCPGSLHMLSNECLVGWHPDFRDRLAALLRPQDEVA